MISISISGLIELNSSNYIQCNKQAQIIRDIPYKFRYSEIEGDVFTAPQSFSLAHCVAVDMKMRAGVAREFRYRYRNVYALKKQYKGIGEVAVLECNDRYIFYLVTKERSVRNCKPTLNDMATCLFSLRDLCRRYNVYYLAIPRIGCGIDKLNWVDVKLILKYVFEKENISISVYYKTEK